MLPGKETNIPASEANGDLAIATANSRRVSSNKTKKKFKQSNIPACQLDKRQGKKLNIILKPCTYMYSLPHQENQVTSVKIPSEIQSDFWSNPNVGLGSLPHRICPYLKFQGLFKYKKDMTRRLLKKYGKKTFDKCL